MSYNLGDRVTVADDYFSEHLRGVIGTITVPEQHVQGHIREGYFWVKFDELQPDQNGGLVEAGAFRGADLRPI
jgi:hypothetical protein